MKPINEPEPKDTIGEARPLRPRCQLLLHNDTQRLLAHRKHASPPATINKKYLSAIREFFDFAKRNNHTLRKTNPAADLRVEVPNDGSVGNERLPFTRKQLQRMFETPLYLGCKSPKRLFEKGPIQIRNHKYWVPLVALFSGCRLNEIGADGGRRHANLQ